ncbi:hypothetical protein SALBM217S_07661 [Streptomyces griseoloalbus]
MSSRVSPATGAKPSTSRPSSSVPPRVSSSSATVEPSGRITRSAECIASPCSVCSTAISEPSCERSPTPADSRCRYSSTGASPVRTRWIVVPSSSVERPTTAVRPSRPSARPAGYEGSRPGAASSSSPPENRCRRQTPNSSPSLSSNHQIHSPSGESTPSVVPFARSVTWRCSPVARSQAYSSYVPVAFDTNRERSGASSAQSGRDTRGARKRFSQSGISPVCCTRSVWWSARSGASDPLLSVMTPYCPSGRASRVLGPQPVDNFVRNFHRTSHTM